MSTTATQTLTPVLVLLQTSSKFSVKKRESYLMLTDE